MPGHIRGADQIPAYAAQRVCILGTHCRMLPQPPPPHDRATLPRAIHRMKFARAGQVRVQISVVSCPRTFVRQRLLVAVLLLNLQTVRIDARAFRRWIRSTATARCTSATTIFRQCCCFCGQVGGKRGPVVVGATTLGRSGCGTIAQRSSKKT